MAEDLLSVAEVKRRLGIDLASTTSVDSGQETAAAGMRASDRVADRIYDEKSKSARKLRKRKTAGTQGSQT